jgi:hypothetical protein
VRLGADQEVGVVRSSDVTQNLRNCLRRQLARSAGAGGVIDQAFFSTKEQHEGLSECGVGSVHPSPLFHGFELSDQGLFIGELAGVQLRVDQLAVDGQLEAAAAAGDQFQVLDLLLEGCQQLGRQTDGLRFVVSH